MEAVQTNAMLSKRSVQKSADGTRWHWRTEFIGQVKYGTNSDDPQAFLVEMAPDDSIPPHFHGVSQFQIFIGGSGRLARNQDLQEPLLVHYADHHTAYGPIVSGPQGFSYFGLRAKSDPGPTYLSSPGYREKLVTSKRRHHSVRVLLSIAPVLQGRTQEVCEPLFKREKDGLSASLLRLGSGMSTAGPNPQTTGGQFYLVANGTLEHKSSSYPQWSVFFVKSSEPPLVLQAGNLGLEVLILEFARDQP